MKMRHNAVKSAIDEIYGLGAAPSPRPDHVPPILPPAEDRSAELGLGEPAHSRIEGIDAAVLTRSVGP
jgi:hypothetical protein